MTTYEKQNPEACIINEAASSTQSGEKYNPNEMDFLVVIRVEDIKKSIDFYCHKLGFIYERLETTGRVWVRAYLRPFEKANTYVCLEQFMFNCPDSEWKPKIYIEIMPGQDPLDYDNYCDQLYRDKGIQFDYDYSISRSPISVVKDPDENSIWIQDGFEYDY